jgi:hypothetical protein
MGLDWDWTGPKKTFAEVYFSHDSSLLACFKFTSGDGKAGENRMAGCDACGRWHCRICSDNIKDKDKDKDKEVLEAIHNSLRQWNGPQQPLKRLLLQLLPLAKLILTFLQVVTTSTHCDK